MGAQTLAEITDPKDPHFGLKRYQVGTEGTYERFFGTVTITAAQLREAVRNFHANARGVTHPETQKPAVHVDYSHDMAGKAAGWVHDLEEDGGKLYAWVKWTPAGEKAVQEGEFIGASMEIDWDYTDNQGAKWGTVFFGWALTNIPEIKNMEPVALSEDDTTKEKPMLEALLKQIKELKAEERATLLNEVLTLNGQPGLIEKFSNVLSENATLKLQVLDLNTKMATGADAGTKTLLSETQAKLATAELELATQKKAVRFSELLAEGKVVPAQKNAYLKGDMDAFSAAAGTKANFNEAGSGTKAADAKNAEEAGAKLHALAEAACASNPKLSYSEALDSVRKLNAELAKLADA